MRLTRIGRGFCLAGSCLGAIGLAGWVTGQPALTTIVPGQAAMMPNTGLSLVLLGVASAFRHGKRASPAARAFVHVAALASLAIGVGTLLEYALGIDLGIDQLLWPAAVGPFPGRPSPPTALAIAFLALANLVLDVGATRRARPSEWLVLGAGLTAFIGLFGPVFGAGSVYELGDRAVIGVAVPTALGLLLISVGLLFARPETGFMRVATSAGLGGVLFRRLVVPGLLAPAVLGFLVTRGTMGLGHSHPALEVAILAGVLALTGLLLLVPTSLALDRTQTALETARAQAHDLIEQASDGVFLADLEGRFTEVNAAGCRLVGRSRSELVGTTIAELLPAGDAARFAAHRARVLAGEVEVGEWEVRHALGHYVPVEVSARLLQDGRWQAFVRDITARRAVEEATRRAQARIEGIVSIAADAIVSIDGEHRITLFNRGAEQAFGWSSAEVLGQPLDCLLPERSRAAHGEHVRRFAAEEASSRRIGEQVHLTGLRRDGSEFPAEAAISKLRIGDEQVFTIVLRDITERQRLERALRDARSFLENVLESSTEYGVIALDSERRIVLWNEGARRCYGYAAAEVTGVRVDVLHVEDDRRSGVALSLYARALERGSAEAVSRRHRKDGSEFMASTVVCRRSAADGAPLGYLVISRDVTREHRRLVHDRLLAEIGPLVTSSLERTQVIESAAELLARQLADYVIVDLVDEPSEEGPAHRRWVAPRDPASRPVARALEGLALDWSRPHLGSMALEAARTTRVSHVTGEYVDSLVQHDEHRRALTALAPTSLVSVPLQARGQVLGALTLVSSDPRRRFDEDDERLAEDVSRPLALAIHNARLFELARKAVAARDEVLSIVAHDLRNPLNVASLSAAVLVRRDHERRVKSRQAAERIQRAIARADRLIQDLLDIARIEATGGLAIEPRAIQLAALATEAADMFAAAAREASVTLEVEASSELPLAWGDEARILQVLGNLLGNALKFTPEGGQIRVSAAHRGAELVIGVVDTGPGIPPEQLAHLFDRFWQASKTDRRGAGLGLAIARGIVEKHGGRIWAESEAGQGTRFAFTLPLASAHERT